MMKQLFNVEGKVAIVTGGSRGIGEMIARGFVENGAKTYITARTEATCQATAEALSHYGECIAIPADLSTLDGIHQFVQAFSSREEKLDILVNNAGYMKSRQEYEALSAAMEAFGETDWDMTMDINLKALFFLTQQLLPALKQAACVDDPARVVNIASNAGIIPPHRHTDYAYTASKAGVINLTRHLAMSLAGDNITVNTISPGLFTTEMTKEIIEQRGQAFARSVPLGRLGKPEDIASAAIYLSSHAGAWLTGVNIPVDGGNVVKR